MTCTIISDFDSGFFVKSCHVCAVAHNNWFILQQQSAEFGRRVIECKANSQRVGPCDLSDVHSNQQLTDWHLTTGLALVFARIALAQELHVKHLTHLEALKQRVTGPPKTTSDNGPLLVDSKNHNHFTTSKLVITREKGEPWRETNDWNRQTKKEIRWLGISPAGRQRTNNDRNTLIKATFNTVLTELQKNNNSKYWYKMHTL